MHTTIQRQLAVILHADVVNSTSLVKNDDIAAHTGTQALFKILDRNIANNHGETIERRGDAVLALFQRASDALAAAQGTQNELSIDQSPTAGFSLRIGISLGEVIIADGTMTGAGVIMAQRLEQLANPGEIVMQAAAAETLPDHIGGQLQKVEQHKIKGFDDPVRVHRMHSAIANDNKDSRSPGNSETTFVPAKKQFLFSIKSLMALLAVSLVCGILFYIEVIIPSFVEGKDTPTIAILPFANLSDDESNVYLSDGITDELIRDLSVLSDLFVISPTSVKAYKDRVIDLPKAAAELNADYLLDGAVEQVNSTLIITAQMIDPEPYRIVWEKKFTRDISDIFTLKNEIGQTVLSSLNIRLTTHQKERLTRKPTNNLEAYNLYQQGRSYTFSASQRRLGNELLRQAIEIDPGFYNAYAALAYSHATAVSFGQSLDKDKELDTAFRLATKAVAMNHQSAEANVALAIAFLLRGKHEESLDAAGRAMEANPGYAAGHGIHGWILTMSGNPSQALASFSQAVRLQPTSNGVVLGVYGATYYMAGRYEEALAILEESITLNPNLLTSHAFLAATYQRLNQPDDAAWEAEEVIALNPDFKITQWRWIETYKNKDDPPLLGLREDLQKAGLAL